MSNSLNIFRIFSEDLKRTFQNFGITITIISLDDEVVDIDNRYLCPISMCLYTIEDLKQDQLTIEHVPPKSLGGKGLVLTSKEINNKDGYTSDKKLLNFFEGENFNSNGGGIDVKISSEELDCRGITAKLSITESIKPRFIINSSRENIKALEYKGLFKHWDGVKFNMTWKLNQEIDRKALLKCAYLIAFHGIGYELLFDSKGFKTNTYGSLIDYLKDTNSNSDFPVIYKNEHAPLDKSLIGFIDSPVEYRSIFVNVTFTLKGHSFKYVVFLPHPEDTCLEKLHSLNNLFQKADKGGAINFKISEFNMSSSNT
jgi:hypothetical protein